MALYPKRIVNSIVKRALRDKQSNNITEESTTDTVKIFTDLKFSDNTADRTVKNCIKKLYSFFVFFFVFVFFFNCYLAVPRPTLGHYRGDSLTHPMLITAFYMFDPKVTESLVTRLGP